MRSPAGLAWGAALAIAAGSILSAVIFRKHKNPREKERRRRELVNMQGRVIEGYVTRCEDGFIEYSYHWRGVRYEASQDISDFLANTSGLIGSPARPRSSSSVHDLRIRLSWLRNGAEFAKSSVRIFRVVRVFQWLDPK